MEAAKSCADLTQTRLLQGPVVLHGLPALDWSAIFILGAEPAFGNPFGRRFIQVGVAARFEDAVIFDFPIGVDEELELDRALVIV